MFMQNQKVLRSYLPSEICTCTFGKNKMILILISAWSLRTMVIIDRGWEHQLAQAQFYTRFPH